MANYYNAQIGVVDASGTVNVIYPITKAANVDYSATINGTAVTTVNAALEKLKTIKAFAYNDLVNLAANTAPTSTSTTAAPTANALTNAYNYLNSNKQAAGSYASSSHTHSTYNWKYELLSFFTSSNIWDGDIGTVKDISASTSTNSGYASMKGLANGSTYYYPWVKCYSVIGTSSNGYAIIIPYQITKSSTGNSFRLDGWFLNGGVNAQLTSSTKIPIGIAYHS